MAPSGNNLSIHPAAHSRLKDLQKELVKEGVVPGANIKDIASALILYTSPQQAAGMLGAYSRYISESMVSDDGDSAD